MTIYIDVLIILNAYVDYILLFACGKLCSIKIKHSRLIIAALVGGVTTLTIFLPESKFTSIIYTLISSLLISFLSFGKRQIIKTTAVFYITACIYSGAVMLIWQLCNTNKIIINNNVVYFDISPFLLIISTIAIYIIISFFKRFIFKSHNETKCSLMVEYNNVSIKLNCLIDSGNLLKDNITNKPIIIISHKSAKTLLGANILSADAVLSLRGYRIIPIKTVSGESVLNAFKPDSIFAETETKRVQINGLIAIGNTAESKGYQATMGLYALTVGEDIIYA